MTTKILKGSAVTEAMNDVLADKVSRLKQRGVEPCLMILRMGGSADDAAYEKGAVKRAEKLGIKTVCTQLPQDAPQERVEEMLRTANADSSIHGVLMMRPLPPHIDDDAVRNILDPRKDVDGITDISMAGVYSGTNRGFSPCTAEACIEILDHFGIKIEGKKACIIGRSMVVGRPAAMMLMRRNATVTVCHTRTGDPAAVAAQADILVVAAGKTGAVDSSFMNSGQTVIDVGIGLDADGNLCGDVASSAADCPAAITPVPGGVGTVTTGMLMKHVVEAASVQNR